MNKETKNKIISRRDIQITKFETRLLHTNSLLVFFFTLRWWGILLYMKSKKFKFTSHFILSFCIPFHSVLPFLLLTLYPFHFPPISCPVSSYFIQSISIHCNSSHFALLVLIPSNHTRQFHTTHPAKFSSTSTNSIYLRLVGPVVPVCIDILSPASVLPSSVSNSWDKS